MTFYLFTTRRLEEVKKKYSDLYIRFNRLAGYLKGKDCRQSIRYLDSAEMLISRMSYGSGDLDKNMVNCIDTLNDLHHNLWEYEKKLGKEELEAIEKEKVPGVHRLMEVSDIGASTDIFAQCIEKIKEVCKETKVKSDDVIMSLVGFGMDPEDARLLLEAIKEDEIIEKKDKEPVKKEDEIKSYAVF